MTRTEFIQRGLAAKKAAESCPRDVDVHVHAASVFFGVTHEEVTSQMRAFVKQQINFGG